MAATLKGGDVGVEIDAIEALKIEDHMLIEELVDVGRHGSFGLGAGMATKGDTAIAWRRESGPLGERPQGSALTPGHCHPGVPEGSHSDPLVARTCPSHKQKKDTRRRWEAERCRRRGPRRW